MGGSSQRLYTPASMVCWLPLSTPTGGHPGVSYSMKLLVIFTATVRWVLCYVYVRWVRLHKGLHHHQPPTFTTGATTRCHLTMQGTTN